MLLRRRIKAFLFRYRRATGFRAQRRSTSDSPTDSWHSRCSLGWRFEARSRTSWRGMSSDGWRLSWTTIAGCPCATDWRSTGTRCSLVSQSRSRGSRLAEVSTQWSSRKDTLDTYWSDGWTRFRRRLQEPDLTRTSKDTVIHLAGEISDSTDGAIVLSFRLMQLDTYPLAWRE